MGYPDSASIAEFQGTLAATYTGETPSPWYADIQIPLACPVYVTVVRTFYDATQAFWCAGDPIWLRDAPDYNAAMEAALSEPYALQSISTGHRRFSTQGLVQDGDWFFPDPAAPPQRLPFRRVAAQGHRLVYHTAAELGGDLPNDAPGLWVVRGDPFQSYAAQKYDSGYVTSEADDPFTAALLAWWSNNYSFDPSRPWSCIYQWGRRNNEWQPGGDGGEAIDAASFVYWAELVYSRPEGAAGGETGVLPMWFQAPDEYWVSRVWLDYDPNRVPLGGQRTDTWKVRIRRWDFQAKVWRDANTGQGYFFSIGPAYPTIGAETVGPNIAVDTWNSNAGMGVDFFVWLSGNRMWSFSGGKHSGVDGYLDTYQSASVFQVMAGDSDAFVGITGAATTGTLRTPLFLGDTASPIQLRFKTGTGRGPSDCSPGLRYMEGFTRSGPIRAGESVTVRVYDGAGSLVPDAAFPIGGVTFGPGTSDSQWHTIDLSALRASGVNSFQVEFVLSRSAPMVPWADGVSYFTSPAVGDIDLYFEPNATPSLLYDLSGAVVFTALHVGTDSGDSSDAGSPLRVIRLGPYADAGEGTDASEELDRVVATAPGSDTGGSTDAGAFLRSAVWYDLAGAVVPWPVLLGAGVDGGAGQDAGTPDSIARLGLGQDSGHGLSLGQSYAVIRVAGSDGGIGVDAGRATAVIALTPSADPGSGTDSGAPAVVGALPAHSDAGLGASWGLLTSAAAVEQACLAFLAFTVLAQASSFVVAVPPCTAYAAPAQGTAFAAVAAASSFTTAVSPQSFAVPALGTSFTEPE